MIQLLYILHIGVFPVDNLTATSILHELVFECGVLWGYIIVRMFPRYR